MRQSRDVHRTMHLKTLKYRFPPGTVDVNLEALAFTRAIFSVTKVCRADLRINGGNIFLLFVYNLLKGCWHRGD